MTDSKTTKRKKGRLAVGIAAAAAALVLLAGGGYFGYQTYAIDSIIEMDVNPSIELRTNRGDRVVKALALNDDAEKILDGMDLKGTDVDVAVNALIGSMLKNGYISDLKNSILISVDNADANKRAALEKKLQKDIDALLKASSVNGSLMTQTLPKDADLEALAGQHGISAGKAALVQSICDKDPTADFAQLATLSINDLNLLAASKDLQPNGVTVSGQASEGAYIGADKAKAAALVHAGVKETDVHALKVELDCEKGKMIYEVEFHYNGTEYEYDIDAETGSVISVDKERDDDDDDRDDVVSPTGANPSGTADAAKQKAAVSAALQHAGVREADAQRLTTELDRDDGVLVYEVEFIANGRKYSYEINAQTAAVIEFSKKPLEGTAQTTQTSAKLLTANEALAAALKDAGLNQSDIKRLETQKEMDDGVLLYEIEFVANGTEYEYEIDAYSGEVLKRG